MIEAQGGGSSGREHQQATRWSRAELTRLRAATDPPIDVLVADYRREHPELTDSRDLVKSMIRQIGQAKSEPTSFMPAVADHSEGWLRAALNVATTGSGWKSDPALIRRGQEVFAANGLYQAAALFFASLPMAYATIDGAAVLARVSDLATQNLTRRVAETGQMLLDVMGLRGDHSLRPGGIGYTTSIGLRLMHACVRVLVLEQPQPDHWPSDRYGPPVNQELLLGTLLDFTVVSWSAMERMGVVLSRSDREANIHTWSVIGDLMGVEACRDRALTVADVEEISGVMTRLLGPSEAGRRLMAALLAEMEGFMPLGWRKLPRSVVRWLFQQAPGHVRDVPDMLAVPAAAWWSKPLLAWARMASSASWFLGPLGRALIRKLGRSVVIAYADIYSNGQAPFRIPDELADSWRIQTTPAARRIRAARRRVRNTVRARGRRRTRQSRI